MTRCSARLVNFKVSTGLNLRSLDEYKNEMVGGQRSNLSLKFLRKSSDQSKTDLEAQYKSFSVENGLKKLIVTNS
jgi:hypothetical protein